ncbi:restriction endonuclease subunit S [Halomonas sp. KM007]
MTVSSMPPQWSSSTLSDVTTIIRGVTYKKAQASNQPFTGSLAILRANNIQGGNVIAKDLVYVPSDLVKPHQRLLKGDIVVAMSSGSKAVVGKTARIKENFDGSFGAFCGVLRPVSKIIPTYLAWFTHSLEYRNRISSLSAGANINNLKPSHFDEIQIPLAPLAEQKVIADKLDTLLAQVENTKARLERIPQILKRFRQSVLAAAVSGRLTEEWRNHNPNSQHPDPAEIRQYWLEQSRTTGKKYSAPEPATPNFGPKLPDSWLMTSIGQVFNVFVGSTPSRGREDYWNGDIPWVSSSEVAFCRITSTKETITETGLSNASTTIHPPGTIMLAMIGQGRTRGQVAISDIPACHNQNTAALRVPQEFVIPDYLYHYLTQQYEETRRIGGGNNQKALNKRVVQSMDFPLPPFEEQTEIVRRVDQLFAHADRIEQQVNNALARVNSLTQSILAKAFRGELTEQWRKDNPELISGENSAAALLARIKAERAASKPAKKTRQKRTTA